MSGTVVTSVATGAAIAAAAAHAAKLRKEEEQMTSYNGNDMDGWEFKIVRANTEYFRKPENLKKVRDEEAQNGWEMVEKFDNNRVRFKRKANRHSGDNLSGIDPYRTTVGIGNGNLVAMILGIIGLFIAGLVLFAVTMKGSVDVPIIIFPVLVIVLVVGIIFAVKKARG
ncbi:MAG: hypothetical protein KAR42_00605 [candidate division Zixibacteria bacterium]|nr:hypothetical protein [candidate division Zixibacteria bacterium]